MLIKIDNLNWNDNAQDPAMHNLRCCINILKIRIGMSDIWQIPRRSLHSYGNLYVTKSELQHQALEVKHVVFSGSLCDQIYFSPSHGLTSAAIHKSKIYSRFTSIRQLMLANLKATPFRVLKCGNKYPEAQSTIIFVAFKDPPSRKSRLWFEGESHFQYPQLCTSDQRSSALVNNNE